MSPEQPGLETNGTVVSLDGTPIAWSRIGSGPDLVMVHCVGVSRATTPQPTLANTLAEHFTVWSYDRRGKGTSGNADTYAVEREVEDLGAIIDMVGGPVTVYGFSSGATLSLIAGEAGAAIDRLVLVEPPLSTDSGADREFHTEGERRLRQGPEELLRWFQSEVVGIPKEILADMPPPSEQSLRDAPSILHELTFLPGTPAERFSAIPQPTLLIASDASAGDMGAWGRQLASAMIDARFMVLPGQWHEVDDETLTTVIRDFAGD
ncbi:alpha/beta fold hydrolase [Corynebacterium sputi]|uniref:alpha/beta fold hydrolase n=1 Tax=Corynebacterium sputi TaxID=489915 RepID=UPI0012EBFAB0|nr:alpha/beta hydrolase [Corynebacterium sputi]